MKNIFNKKRFDKNHFSNVCIFILIVLFSCLIIYQIYLAIINKQNHSKLVEGLTTLTLNSITPQANITCTGTTILPNNFYNVVITDISNIEIINNNVIDINNNVNGLITTYNNSQSSTQLDDLSLNDIAFNKIPSSPTNSNYFKAVNTNVSNINIINTNINNIFTIVKQLPNGTSATSNTKLSTLSSTNLNANNICQTENTNIININALNTNTTSLNIAVNKLITIQNNQLSQQSTGMNSLSQSVGVTTG